MKRTLYTVHSLHWKAHGVFSEDEGWLQPELAVDAGSIKMAPAIPRSSRRQASIIKAWPEVGRVFELTSHRWLAQGLVLVNSLVELHLMHINFRRKTQRYPFLGEQFLLL